MKHKHIIFGSIFTVFLMLMIPNINAVEYQNVKEAYTIEKGNIILQANNLTGRVEKIFDLALTLIVFITSILQGIFMILTYLFSEVVASQFENQLIEIIITLLTGFLSGFILTKWSYRIDEQFDLSDLDQLILGLIPWIIYYLFASIYINISETNTK